MQVDPFVAGIEVKQYDGQICHQILITKFYLSSGLV